MRTQNETWSLFRLSDRKQFDDVSAETIEFFYRALGEKNRIDWLMWRDGLVGWRPLGELAQILTHLENDLVKAPVPPPVPESVLKFADEISSVKSLPEDQTATNPTRVIEAVTSTLRQSVSKVSGTQTKRIAVRENAAVLSIGDEATLSLMLESQVATDDRDNVRYSKVFKVRIFAPKGVISAVTIDCSTSGFRLKEALPSGMPRYFNVELDLGGGVKIPLVCSEVREKDGSPGTRVRIQVNDHLNTLKSALFRAA